MRNYGKPHASTCKDLPTNLADNAIVGAFVLCFSSLILELAATCNPNHVRWTNILEVRFARLSRNWRWRSLSSLNGLNAPGSLAAMFGQADDKCHRVETSIIAAFKRRVGLPSFRCQGLALRDQRRRTSDTPTSSLCSCNVTHASIRSQREQFWQKQRLPDPCKVLAREHATRSYMCMHKVIGLLGCATRALLIPPQHDGAWTALWPWQQGRLGRPQPQPWRASKRPGRQAPLHRLHRHLRLLRRISPLPGEERGRPCPVECRHQLERRGGAGAQARIAKSAKFRIVRSEEPVLAGAVTQDQSGLFWNRERPVGASATAAPVEDGQRGVPWALQSPLALLQRCRSAQRPGRGCSAASAARPLAPAPGAECSLRRRRPQPQAQSSHPNQCCRRAAVAALVPKSLPPGAAGAGAGVPVPASSGHQWLQGRQRLGCKVPLQRPVISASSL